MDCLFVLTVSKGLRQENHRRCEESQLTPPFTSSYLRPRLCETMHLLQQRSSRRISSIYRICFQILFITNDVWLLLCALVHLSSVTAPAQCEYHGDARLQETPNKCTSRPQLNWTPYVFFSTGFSSVTPMHKVNNVLLLLEK